MRAMDHEPSGRNGRQAAQRLHDPIFSRDGRERKRVSRCKPGGGDYYVADHALIHGTAKIERDSPLASAVIHKASRHIVGEFTVDKAIGDTSRRLFIGHEHCRHAGRARGCGVIHCGIIVLQNPPGHSQATPAMHYSIAWAKYYRYRPQILRSMFTVL